MNLGRCLLVDIQSGKFYLVVALLLGFFSGSLVLLGAFLQCTAWSVSWGSFTLGDYIFMMYGGALPPSVDELSRLLFPVGWLLLIVGCMFVPLVYPQQNLRQGGVPVILACGDRSSWLIAKMLWSAISAMVFWAGVGASCLFVVVMGDADPSFSAAEAAAMASVPSPYVLEPAPYDMRSFCLVAFFTSGVLAITLSVISLLGSSGVGFISLLGLTVPSLFLMSPLLPGHYLMALRSSEVVADGVTIIQALGSGVAVLVGIVAVAIWLFMRIDFLGGALKDD